MWVGAWVLVQIIKYLAQLYRWSRTKSHTTQTNDRPRSPRQLPIEVIEHCASFLFEIRSPSGDVAQARISSVKPAWREVSGFMAASPSLHQVGLARWVAMLTIRHERDWKQAVQWSYLVRELRCLDGALESNQNQRVLAEFQRLHTLSVDAHGDVVYDQHGRFAYRDIFSSLPRSLRRLEILRAHGPDISIINTVKTTLQSWKSCV
ncbi:hypothetical protein RhiLY_02615 [Ceratobasidium sp. AG-Ba]|nr:hypothetical protein RhiLY_02615 [Ceratobasidium sp. AG-Ba]